MSKPFFNHAPVSYYLLAIILFAGCAKETTTVVNTTSNSSSQSTIATDELTVNNEFNQSVDDAITLLNNHKAIPAGSLVDTSQLNLGVIEIDYLSKEADNTKTRTGNDSIHFNKSIPWGTPGATATVSFGDINNKAYEVSFINNLTSLTFKGSATITNVSGGLLQNLTSGDSIVMHIKSTISLTFNDNATVVQLLPWSMNHIRTFTLSGSNIYAYTRGDSNYNSTLNIGTIGTDRYNNSFYSVINNTIVQNISTANLSYNPLSGTESIEGIQEPITTTYGVNSQGNVVTSGTPYGFSIGWINNGGAASAILPYYY